MSVRNWAPIEVTNPRAAWTQTSLVRKGSPTRGGVSQNVRVNPGVVQTRPGTAAVFSVASKVTGMYNWLSPYLPPNSSDQNLVLYQEGTNIKRRRLSDLQTDTLLAGVTGRGPVFAELGPRVYFCDYDTSGYGTIDVRIHDGNFTTGVPNVDTAFRGPLTATSFTAADGGVGSCTQGTHKLGFVFQSRSGFAGNPSPVVATVFTPASVTLNAGLRAITLSVTLNTPADAGLGSAFLPIMTRNDDPANWYFVPTADYGGAIILPPSTAAWSFTVTINISDDDLANAESANAFFDKFTGSLKPNHIASYGKRMTYVVGTSVYASDIDDPQSISLDLHLLNLPSQRKIGSAFQLGTSYYLTGDKWTGRTEDNGDLPSTWPQPMLTSDSIGGPFPNCVEWHTENAKAWVAAESGVYLFDGAYPDHPVTYLWGDQWALVNWNAAYAIQMANDPVNLKLYVAVPTGSNTECDRIFVIDYTNGYTYDTCDITVDLYASLPTFSSIRLVKEIANSRTALWIGPAAAGSVVHFDPALIADSEQAIHAIWESGYCRNGELASRTVRVGNADYWIRGTGPVPTITWYGLDRTTNVVPAIQTTGDAIITTLSSAPGVIYYAKGDLPQTENFVVRVESQSATASWELSGFTFYIRPGLYSR
jgi:hypothetical protein